ncbi:MAG: phosphoribosylanthranilate isomerase [Acidobacteria bacterium]|nr:phosphoribosylanthranilate isomerase [Acidobacteriota bacterium]
MWLKICGVTREEDARLAASLGADAIGLVFWPHSRRSVDVERARRIAGALPAGVAAVGVFVDEAVERVRLVASQVGLHLVQLHGTETPEACRQMPRPVIKAFGVGPAFDPSLVDAYAEATVLLDADAPESKGGTGTRADWEVAARVARRRRVILSGGLSPENVAEAIARVAPHGVDVSSGVEASPGIKDAERMRRFVVAVRQAGGRA